MNTFASCSRANAVDEPRVVLLAEEAAAEPVRVDARLGREHAHEQLLLRHFQAEDADGLAGLDRRSAAPMLSTKLVFPIDGRAATMTRSDFWKPDVISSRSTKPLGTPVTRPLCACSCSMSW